LSLALEKVLWAFGIHWKFNADLSKANSKNNELSLRTQPSEELPLFTMAIIPYLQVNGRNNMNNNTTNLWKGRLQCAAVVCLPFDVYRQLQTMVHKYNFFYTYIQ